MSNLAEPATLPFALTRPIHIAAVALQARDVPSVAGYYRKLLGLETISRSGGGETLGAGGVGFLDVLPLGADGLSDDPRSAGLFHTAFLMPSRADLGRWVTHVAEDRIPVDGMSDHLVSEAFYLSDPEGNGVEVYADRLPESWPWDGGSIRMATNRLDVGDVAAAAGDTRWSGAPEALRIGHVHLRAGDPAVAEDWWHDEVGLVAMAHYPGAAFLASGGYHHHIAANSWQSRGAGKRDPKRSGLAHVTLSGSAIERERELADPWGTVVRLVPVA